MVSLFAITAHEEAEDCLEPGESYVAYTCTDAAGNFSFDVDLVGATNTVFLTVAKGAFQNTIQVTLSPGETQSVVGDIPITDVDNPEKLAVVTGGSDSMETVLTRAGFAPDIFDGTSLDDTYPSFLSLDDIYPSFLSLFEDGDASGSPDIYDYDIVFINCGNVFEFQVLNDAAKVAILKNYVAIGGRLYVTDQAYNFVEQVFPEYIDFYGSDDTPAHLPEAMYAALRGIGGVTYNATIDNMLGNWLELQNCYNGASCLNADGTIHIEGFLPAWAMINGVHPNTPEPVDVLVSVPLASGESMPLTVTFGHGLGRVLYTSYHTVSGSSYVNLTPQEHLLLQLITFD